MAHWTPAPRFREFRISTGYPARADRLRRFAILLAALAAGLLLPGAPATAQVAANVTLATNQLFRGETISGDDPGLTVAVSADLPGGLFAGADVSLAAGGESPRFTASNQYAGIAKRLGGASLEAGAIHRIYAPLFDEAYRRHYTELYAGISLHKVQLRVFVSPDYLADGRTTYYIEANARLATIGQWKLEGHGGISLIPHDLDSPEHGLISYEDWSLRASRGLGPFTFGVGIAATNYPVFGPSGKVRLSAQLSRSF
jgi:uncharacterized protein (TIGR02001 family)